MSRDIKFRGKRIDNGEWVYGDLITGLNGEMFIHHRLSPVEFTENALASRLVLYKVDPETVGQYTGLKDKNGKEIYEGDIVRREWVEIHPEGYDFTGVVKFIEGSFCIESLDDEYFGEYLFVEIGTNEVIGNIHDNPELLEARSDIETNE